MTSVIQRREVYGKFTCLSKTNNAFYGVFFFFLTPTGYPTIQFNSDTNYLELCSPHRLRPQSHKTTPTSGTGH